MKLCLIVADGQPTLPMGKHNLKDPRLDLAHQLVEANGGETGAKRAGKQRLEMKSYVMQDYDVTSFRHNS